VLKVIGSVLHCPFEVLSIKMWLSNFGLENEIPRIDFKDFAKQNYKALGLLLSRQVPYTMIKFTVYENISSIIYKNILREKKLQLLVSFISGFLGGACCVILSHPFDVFKSKFNNL
jgi:hypothetical protein